MTSDVIDTSNLNAGSKVISRAQGEQACARQKRGRSACDHPEASLHAAAHAIKNKKLCFTEPLKDDGKAPRTLTQA